MKRDIKSTVLAALVSGTCLYGSTNANITDSVANELLDYKEPTKIYSSSDVVFIPEQFRSHFLNTHLVTVEELMKLESLDINVDSSVKDEDLAWLNYCINLRDLTIHTTNCDALKGIKDLPKLQHLTLIADNIDYNSYLSKENCNFIEKSKDLEILDVGNYNIDPKLVESLKQVDTLVLNAQSDAIVSNYNFDYNKLSSLKHIIVNRPGSFVIHLDQNDLNQLKNNGVSIETNLKGNNEDISGYLTDINDSLSSIINLYHFDQYDNDEDKVKAVLAYIINKNQYDYSNIESSNSIIRNLYYQDGFLYGAISSNNIICGNYSALVSAFLQRLGVENYLIVENRHAYNVVKIGSYFQYVDATLLDYLSGNDNLSSNDISLNRIYTDLNDIHPLAANYIQTDNYIQPNNYIQSSNYIQPDASIIRFPSVDFFYGVLGAAGLVDVYFAFKIKNEMKKEKERKERIQEQKRHYIQYMNQKMREQQLKEKQLREQQFRLRQLQNQKIILQKMKEQLLREKQFRENNTIGRAYPASARYVYSKVRSQ
ncbi:MAG: hypothetical protein IJG68_07870 [Bacilli bacterium]|nr:hypothetical protein [Bacilli bacterium]